jgi:hypothetical protein
MSNLFIESLERFKRHRKARGKFDDEKHLEEPYVDELEAGYRRAFKNSKVYNRENYRDSCWYKFLQRDLMDLNERDGKTSRLRFTVPFQLYQQLLGFAERWFPQRKFDACGKEVTPISLKLLGTLRILGKGCSWDLLYEL